MSVLVNFYSGFVNSKLEKNHQNLDCARYLRNQGQSSKKIHFSSLFYVLVLNYLFHCIIKAGLSIDTQRLGFLTNSQLISYTSYIIFLDSQTCLFFVHVNVYVCLIYSAKAQITFSTFSYCAFDKKIIFRYSNTSGFLAIKICHKICCHIFRSTLNSVRMK